MDNKKSILRYKMLRHFIAGLLIIIMAVPIIILDLYLEINHRIIFILYGIPFIKRNKYIRIDRHKLEYLNVFDKMWCVYCGYVNGLFAYAVKTAGRIEKYWCGIKHKEDKSFFPPKHHKDFMAYGDKRAYIKLLEKKSKNNKKRAI